MTSPPTDTQPGYPEIFVGPTCHIQTAEDRFGPNILEDLRTFVYAPPHDSGFAMQDDDDGGADDDEDDESDDMDFDMYEFDFTVDPPTLETDPEHAQHGFPRIATTRNNLTALSQRYNLYFAAYQDHIYIYQPRAAPKILPSPSLILRPRPSKVAASCESVIDRTFGHQVNHIIVGNLGDLEIVLMAYDDGDVIAYYTHAIVRCIKANSDHLRGTSACYTRPATHLKPCFHENVGISAWGLAIHEQSRLIAVGSNHHEVTVFALAVSHSGVAVELPEVDRSPLVPSGQTALELEKHFRSRTRTWKITLPLGPTGHNIPNIDFINDEDGEAERVAAIDIFGTVWLLDIWKIGTMPIRWRDDSGAGRVNHGNVRGWGVLILPDSSFRPTKNVRESLGLPASEVLTLTAADQRLTTWLDTTCGLYYIKELSSNSNRVFRARTHVDYAGNHNAKQGRKSDDEQSDTWQSDSEDWDEPLSRTPKVKIAGETSGGWPGASYQTKPQPERYGFTDIAGDFQVCRRIIPCFGETPGPHPRGPNSEHILFGEMAKIRKEGMSPIDFTRARLPDHMVKNFSVLRCSTTDIQLQPFDAKLPSVECNFAITAHNQPGATPPWDLSTYLSERLSMLIHVPELNLVVAGSPTGRVALVTLTKTARRIRSTPVRRGFRIDCVLPRRSEDQRGVRPICSLIGVAVSPAPDCRAKGLSLFSDKREGRRAVPPVMYRLIMHYKDHTILMYDLARGDGDDDGLMIF
ncbi:hypothetical protein VTK26DRAFT_3515 [Humicola hyalothermophila]